MDKREVLKKAFYGNTLDFEDTPRIFHFRVLDFISRLDSDYETTIDFLTEDVRGGFRGGNPQGDPLKQAVPYIKTPIVQGLLDRAMQPVKSSFVKGVGAYKGHLLIEYHHDPNIWGYPVGSGQAAKFFNDILNAGSKGAWVWENLLQKPKRGGWTPLNPSKGMAKGKFFAPGWRDPFTSKGAQFIHPLGRPAKFTYNPVGYAGMTEEEYNQESQFEKLDKEKIVSPPESREPIDPKLLQKEQERGEKLLKEITLMLSKFPKGIPKKDFEDIEDIIQLITDMSESECVKQGFEKYKDDPEFQAKTREQKLGFLYGVCEGKGIPKKDGSGEGKRKNYNRGGCNDLTEDTDNSWNEFIEWVYKTFNPSSEKEANQIAWSIVNSRKSKSKKEKEDKPKKQRTTEELAVKMRERAQRLREASSKLYDPNVPTKERRETASEINRLYGKLRSMGEKNVPFNVVVKTKGRKSNRGVRKGWKESWEEVGKGFEEQREKRAKAKMMDFLEDFIGCSDFERKDMDDIVEDIVKILDKQGAKDKISFVKATYNEAEPNFVYLEYTGFEGDPEILELDVDRFLEMAESIKKRNEKKGRGWHGESERHSEAAKKGKKDMTIDFVVDIDNPQQSNFTIDFKEDYTYMYGPISHGRKGGHFDYRDQSNPKKLIRVYKDYNSLKEATKVDYFPIIGTQGKGSHKADVIGFSYGFEPNDETEEVYAHSIIFNNLEEISDIPKDVPRQVSIGFDDEIIGDTQYIKKIDHLAMSLDNDEIGRCELGGKSCYMKVKEDMCPYGINTALTGLKEVITITKK